jgi:hypothetical protein
LIDWLIDLADFLLIFKKAETSVSNIGKFVILRYDENLFMKCATYLGENPAKLHHKKNLPNLCRAKIREKARAQSSSRRLGKGLFSQDFFSIRFWDNKIQFWPERLHFLDGNCTQKCKKKIIKTFRIDNFSHLHLELQISPQIF